MEDLRSRAFRVYLQHALASALTVESEVNQRKQHIDEQSVKAVTQRALKYTQNALESDRPGEEELQALWRLCAKYMRAAAAEAGTTDGDSLAWECTCNSLALLARNLEPAVRILADMCTANPIVLDCTEIRGRLLAVFQQIDDSPLVRDPTGVAVRHFGTKAIQSTIEAITFALQRVASGSMQEDISMQRFIAAADKVNVDQSPAHRYIRQCWLNAAEQMRLAIATTMVSENKQHQRRSRVHTNLAHGPLATAAEYFVKADLAVSPQAKDLWRQAAQLTLETAIPYVQQSHLRDPFTEYTTCADEMSMQRVHHLAEAASCCEHVHAVEGTFQELRKAELQLRLALLERDAAAPPDNLGCWSCCMPLLDWCLVCLLCSVCLP
jgi:hypothetical protein